MTTATPDVLFAHAYRQAGCTGVMFHADNLPPTRLPVEKWSCAADENDRVLVSYCVGSTLDIGCGPGRLTAQLASDGSIALGVDVVPDAIEQTVARGASALRRSVFEPLPREGRWDSALLADGNIGIGGDPLALLARVRQLLRPGGRLVAEVHPPGTPSQILAGNLHCSCGDSASLPWAVVGADDVGALAFEVGFTVELVDRMGTSDRWFAVLELS